VFLQCLFNVSLCLQTADRTRADGQPWGAELCGRLAAVLCKQPPLTAAQDSTHTAAAAATARRLAPTCTPVLAAFLGFPAAAVRGTAALPLLAARTLAAEVRCVASLGTTSTSSSSSSSSSGSSGAAEVPALSLTELMGAQNLRALRSQLGQCIAPQEEETVAAAAASVPLRIAVLELLGEAARSQPLFAAALLVDDTKSDTVAAAAAAVVQVLQDSRRASASAHEATAAAAAEAAAEAHNGGSEAARAAASARAACANEATAALQQRRAVELVCALWQARGLKQLSEVLTATHQHE
jgi:hypothetical protein